MTRNAYMAQINLQINSDRAMVFVITAMEVFNNENLLGFLKRSWKIVHGDSSLEKLKMKIVHTCAFHFIKNSKEILKETLPVSNRKIGMWIPSLLMNRDNMQDLDPAVKLVNCNVFEIYNTTRPSFY